MSLAEVENMAALQLFTVGESGGMLPQENLINSGVLRCILVHSEKHTELLERGSSSKEPLLAELLEHWKPSPSANVYINYRLCYIHRCRK